MKAELNKNGVLKIKATNELEGYALHQWWKNYQAKGKDATLSIETNQL